MVAISKDIIYKDATITDTWNGVEIEIKRSLTAEQAAAFIRFVFGSSITDDGNYLPEVEHTLARIATVAAYTNIELPEDANEQYDLVYGTDICDWITDRINYDQFAAIEDGIRERRLAFNRDKANVVERQMNDMYASLSSLVSTLESTVGEVSGEQLGDFLKLLSNTNIDEKKVVSAVFDEKAKRKQVKPAKEPE